MINFWDILNWWLIYGLKSEKYFSATMSRKMISLTLNNGFHNKSCELIFERVCFPGKNFKEKDACLHRGEKWGYTLGSLFSIYYGYWVLESIKSNHESISRKETNHQTGIVLHNTTVTLVLLIKNTFHYSLRKLLFY